MAVTIYEPEEKDLALFLELWKRYLAELHGAGGLVMPTDRSLQHFGRIFLAYRRRNLLGRCLFAREGREVIAVQMAGMLEEKPSVDTRFDPFAHALGTWVREDHRGSGVSKMIRKRMAKTLKRLGFNYMVGSERQNNGAIRASRSFGFKPFEMMTIADIRGL